MIGEGFVDPEKDLVVAERNARIVQMRVEGMSFPAIARQEGINVRTAMRAVSEHATAVRERTGQIIEEAFMLHVERLDAWFAAAQRFIDEATTIRDFLNAVRAGLLILERQARLLGLDRDRAVQGANKQDWLDGATEEELRRKAEHYGLKVPEKFRSG